MDARSTWIRALHTAVWLFFNAVMAYLYYAMITNRVDVWAWIGLGLFGVECLVLVVYRMSCPLTLVARKYTDSTRSNFAIWLPEWPARHNKWIYGILVGGGHRRDAMVGSRVSSLFSDVLAPKLARASSSCPMAVATRTPA